MNPTGQEGPFNAEEIALLARLTPHLKQALNMHRALSRERPHHAVMRHTLETLDLALISLDGRTRAPNDGGGEDYCGGARRHQPGSWIFAGRRRR